MLDTQRNVNVKMREILIDWLMEVSEEFMIKRDTLYICVNFIDRYISLADYELQKQELQLIGVTSLFLACKVEEVYIPRVADFALATDGGYTKEQILEMEFQIMKVLKYKLHPVTLCTWANWYLNMWDVYAEQNLRHFYPHPGHDLSFKSPNEVAYQRLRIVL
jgi:Cyclin, N-terminal domain